MKTKLEYAYTVAMTSKLVKASNKIYPLLQHEIILYSTVVAFSDSTIGCLNSDGATKNEWLCECCEYLKYI